VKNTSVRSECFSFDKGFCLWLWFPTQIHHAIQYREGNVANFRAGARSRERIT
jgi:hypothetical protein